MNTKNRALCWDTSIIAKSENIQVEMHKPIKKNIALYCDNEWEGVTNGYSSVLKVGDNYRLYYRSDRHNFSAASRRSSSNPSQTKIRDTQWVSLIFGGEGEI